MRHTQALSLAEDALNGLTPYCERICIAGSIRRMKPEVKDVEMVCMPKSVPAGLFSDVLEVDPDFCTIVKRWPKVKGEPTGKYTQRRLPGGIALDLFMVEPESWGLQLVIRTGSWQFSKYIVGDCCKRAGYASRDGQLWRQGQRIPTPEEVDVFSLLNVSWVEPWAREV